jgi:antitoxin component YwqK of YwqJK toxin-antitoxin module
LQKYYSQRGVLENQQHYMNERLNGEQIFYHSNGSVWIKKIYDNGKLMEVVENKDSFGNTMNNGKFQRGKGVLRIYNEQGLLFYKEYYLSGKMLLRVKKKNRSSI